MHLYVNTPVKHRHMTGAAFFTQSVFRAAHCLLFTLFSFPVISHLHTYVSVILLGSLQQTQKAKLSSVDWRGNSVTVCPQEETYAFWNASWIARYWKIRDAQYGKLCLDVLIIRTRMSNSVSVKFTCADLKHIVFVCVWHILAHNHWIRRVLSLAPLCGPEYSITE